MRLKVFYSLLIITSSLTLGCQKNPLSYDNSVVDLGLGFTAREMCSCMFVAQRTLSQCNEYVQVKQVTPKVSVDKSSKEITASLFWIFKRTSKFINIEKGCLLK